MTNFQGKDSPAWFDIARSCFGGCGASRFADATTASASESSDPMIGAASASVKPKGPASNSSYASAARLISKIAVSSHAADGQISLTLRSKGNASAGLPAARYRAACRHRASASTHSANSALSLPRGASRCTKAWARSIRPCCRSDRTRSMVCDLIRPSSSPTRPFLLWPRPVVRTISIASSRSPRLRANSTLATVSSVLIRTASSSCRTILARSLSADTFSRIRPPTESQPSSMCRFASATFLACC